MDRWMDGWACCAAASVLALAPPFTPPFRHTSFHAHWASASPALPFPKMIFPPFLPYPLRANSDAALHSAWLTNTNKNNDDNLPTNQPTNQPTRVMFVLLLRPTHPSVRPWKQSPSPPSPPFPSLFSSRRRPAHRRRPFSPFPHSCLPPCLCGDIPSPPLPSPTHAPLARGTPPSPAQPSPAL